MRDQVWFDDFEGHKYTAFTTYRKNGTPVVTPVWFVKRDGKLFIWTARDSGKAKRLRNNPCVQLDWSHRCVHQHIEYMQRTGRFLPRLFGGHPTPTASTAA